MGKFLLLFLILTFSEVYLMKVVAERTSFLFLFSVVLTTGIIGLSLAKKQGKEHLLKVQQELASGKIPGNPMIEGLMILVAAAVLITPGFITDVLGFLLLVSPVRKLLAPGIFSLFKPKMSSKSSSFFHFSAGGDFNTSSQNDSKPVDIEKKAYEILSYGEKAPVILKKNMGNKTVYHFFFHYNSSTLPYKIAFPIMITNTVNKALADAGLSEKSGNKTGTFPETFLNPDTEYTIKSPNGKLEKIKSSERGLISGISTVDSGTYEILEGKENIQTIGISLLSPSETSLQKLNSVKFNEISVTVNEEEAQTDKSLWGMISLIAFLFLIIEWWYFQKKPGSLTKRSA